MDAAGKWTGRSASGNSRIQGTVGAGGISGTITLVRGGRPGLNIIGLDEKC